MSFSGSAVVEYKPHHGKVKSSSQDDAVSTKRKKMAIIKNTIESFPSYYLIQKWI